MRFQPPTVKIDSRGMVFNKSCVLLMPDVGYVQLRENRNKPTTFFIKSCGEHDSYSMPWRASCGNKIYPRKYKDYGGYFYELCKRMHWFSDCNYIIKAEYVSDGSEFGLLFHFSKAVPSNPLVTAQQGSKQE